MIGKEKAVEELAGLVKRGEKKEVEVEGEKVQKVGEVFLEEKV